MEDLGFELGVSVPSEITDSIDILDASSSNSPVVYKTHVYFPKGIAYEFERLERPYTEEKRTLGHHCQNYLSFLRRTIF
jgi:hypothetical protein